MHSFFGEGGCSKDELVPGIEQTAKGTFLSQVRQMRDRLTGIHCVGRVLCEERSSDNLLAVCIGGYSSIRPDGCSIGIHGVQGALYEDR